MSIADEIAEVGHRAREASHAVAALSAEQKNAALLAMADGLEAAREKLQRENEKDLEAGKEKGLSAAMIDRLRLSDKVVASMAQGLGEVAQMEDPVGAVRNMVVRPNGMRVGRMRIPLGVVGMIYESRPNVTADAAGLCLKAGNAVVLRGGSEAIHSNKAVATVLQDALAAQSIPGEAIQVIQITDRQAVLEMLKLEQYIDLIIPRGGESLIHFVTEHSIIPVIKHYKGVCHTYVDKDADLGMAVSIAVNAKTQRPGVCNAMETLLVHEAIAANFLPKAGKALIDAGVELRVCDESSKHLGDIPHKSASEEDYFEEYLELILAIRIVSSLDGAVQHIFKYGSDHTEVIVTDNYAATQEFLRRVTSSCVFVNASSRFADGQRLGLGAEIGISTSKLHAYGPMGLEGLTTEKFIAYGDGQIVE